MAAKRTVDPTGAERGAPIAFRITAAQRAALLQLAEQRGVTFSDLLRELIERELTTQLQGAA